MRFRGMGRGTGVDRCTAMSAMAGAAALGVVDCALAAETGVTDTRVKIGQSPVFTGPAKDFGVDYKACIALAFDKVNKTGGVNGRTARRPVQCPSCPIVCGPDQHRQGGGGGARKVWRADGTHPAPRTDGDQGVRRTAPEPGSGCQWPDRGGALRVRERTPPLSRLRRHPPKGDDGLGCRAALASRPC